MLLKDASLSPFPALQIYETQLNELSIQTQSLTADIGVKEGVLQEARDIINSKVHDVNMQKDNGNPSVVSTSLHACGPPYHIFLQYEYAA